MTRPQFPELQALLESNRQWAEAVTEKEPEFLVNSAKGQKPKFLWFGCSDSRVPESVIMAQKPGEVFVHRNIANQFHPDDDSANAVLQFAVDTVGVTHVIVKGHSSCGGCVAAHGAPPPSARGDTPLARFLTPLIELRHSMKECAVDELIEANVKRGVQNIADSAVMQAAWAKHAKGEMRPVYIHGWVYDLASGRLRDLDISQGPGL